MQGAKIRNYALVILVLLAAASMFPSFGGSDSAHTHRANPQPHKPQAAAAKTRPQIRASFRINK
jgi:hypothetical protein